MLAKIECEPSQINDIYERTRLHFEARVYRNSNDGGVNVSIFHCGRWYEVMNTTIEIFQSLEI